MARVFLDTNIFIDAIHRKPEHVILESLENHILNVSSLSFNIYCYYYKIAMPNYKVLAQKEKFKIVDFSENILQLALSGPTRDLEDNVQLHSAAEVECDVFLTADKNLLKLKFFGKSRIIKSL